MTPCFQTGLRAEERFADLARHRQHQTIAATRQQDMHEHWDWRLVPADIRVDVKAMKKLNRSDQEPQDEWTWIELQSVREGNTGWLYGQADVIAFEVRDGFLLVPRLALVELVERLVDFNTRVAQREEARYRVYQRPGRHDLITLIETRHLRAIAQDIWS